MTAPATQFKLGLFVLCAIAAVVAIAVALGLHARKPVVRYHTYFDESVSGLEIGSSVAFRGIRVGSVGAIALAPDGTRIDVALDVTEAQAAKLGLDERASHLRARLASTGITGVKSVDLAPEEADTPPPVLSFAPAPRYIPPRRSLLDSLEDRADRIASRIPEVLDRAVDTLDKVEGWLDDIRGQRLEVRLAGVIDHADAAIGEVRGFAHSLRGDLTDRSHSVLDHLDSAATSARDFLSKLDRGGELERTVRDVGEAARAFRELVEEVDRDPDMLVKGRARSRGP